jgi:RNA polymerase sigma-54 factor
MLKQRLSQKMLQKLSPQQIQLMKLLQVPTATLDQRIKEELEENPALEEGEDSDVDADLNGYDEAEKEEGENENAEADSFELDDYLTDYIEDDPSSYRYRTENYSDNESKSIPVAVNNTFHDYLAQQLSLLNISDARKLIIALQIVGSIDEDGYLRREPVSIIDDLLFSQNIDATPEEVEELLVEIQKFDPAGVGARNLRECLIIQLKQKMNKELEETGRNDPNRELAYAILEFYFEEFSKKHYHKLERYLKLTEKQLKAAVGEILKLNPKPASTYQGDTSSGFNYVVPDFIISNRDGELELTINSKNAPDLKINDHYVDMLKSYKVRKQQKKVNREDKQTVMFIKQKIDSAKWFIDAIKQRQQTLYKTMSAIMQFQYDYFLTGDERKLKPMILKDIAEITALDISTVSRVANSKFVQTEFGTKRLKDFFSESLQTQSGEEVSTLEVKNMLSEVIGDENKRKPLSDEKLKNMLQKKGYNIARRTVAKYREQLNIPVARLRKEL